MSPSALVPPWRTVTPRRPGVDQASPEALIPLRPLTLGEIMDAAFFVIQRRAGMMLGLPLAVSLVFWLLLSLMIGATRVLVGGLEDTVMAVLLLVLLGLTLAVVFLPVYGWICGVISQAAAQEALGDGFAPDVSRVRMRTSRRMFWPMVGLTVLMVVALSAWSAVGQTVSLLSLLTDQMSDEVAVWYLIGLGLITLLLWAWGSAYVLTAVPVCALESSWAPGWIGKPHRPTNIVTAFVRAFQLIGIKQSLRAALLVAGSLVIGAVVSLATLGGTVLAALSYLQAMAADLDAVVDNAWLIAVFVLFAVLLAVALCLAYAVSAQTMLYLDLRMRREGLDLAMRFDDVEVPQPDGAPGALR